MLLRSSSTPLLGSLITSKDVEDEVKSCGSLQTCLIGCVSVVRDHSYSAQENLKRELEQGIARLPTRVRKVKSENDLQTLVGKRAFSSPAQVAARSLLRLGENGGERGGFQEIAIDSPFFPRQSQQLLQNPSLPSYNFASDAGKKTSSCSDDLLHKRDELSYFLCHSSTHEYKGHASVFSDLGASKTMRSETTMVQATSLKILGWRSSADCECLNSQASEVIRSERLYEPKASRESNVGGFISYGEPAQVSFSQRKTQSNLLWKISAIEELSEPGLTPGCVKTEKLGCANDLSGGGYGNRNGKRTNGGGGGRGGDGGGLNGDCRDSDEYYQRMLKVDPFNPLLLRNYACFLFEARKDFRRAEEYFERAILAMPGEGEVLALYANLIWQVHRDADRAASYFDRAVQAAPTDPFVLAANASFIWASETDREEFEEPCSTTFTSYREATTVSA